MEVKTVAEINQYTGSSVNPLEYPEQIFELYSVPSFETGYPEIIKGKEIGSTKITVKEGDVLVCKINPRINRVWVVRHNTEHPLLASSEWIVVRNSELDSNYLKWYFTSPTFRALLNSQVAGIGGSLTRAQPKQVAKYPIPIPSVAEQENISKILDKVDRLMSLRKEQLAKLDQLVKARFVEMFGKYINEGGKPLSEFATITGGLTKNSKRNTYNLKMPYLRVANVFFNRLDLKEILKIGVYEDEIEKTLLQTGDLLFVEGNGSIEQIGRVALWDGSISPILHQNHLIKARFHSKTILPEFALFYFMSQEGRQQIINKSVSTSGLNTLSVKKIGSLILPMPPIDLQKQFVDFLTQADKSKLTIQQSLDKLEMVKKVLMQEYFGQ